MKFSRVTAAMVMVSLSAPLFAASGQAVGTLTSTTPGTVIAREGKLLTAHAGQSLFVGDRVITRGSSAKVAMQGCNISLAPTSILSVGTAGCAEPKSFTKAAQDTTADGSAATGGSSTGYIIGALAVAAVAGGVVAATSNTSSRSVSP